MAVAASTLFHASLLAILLLLPHGKPPGEDIDAPAFAIQFDSGAAQSTPSPATEPRVSLGGSDYPPPPPQPSDAPPVPLPRLQYGSALNRQARNNPFAHVVPFDLSPSQPRSLSAGPPGSRGLDLAAGPIVRNGRIQDSVAHVMGRHGHDDYFDELREFVEEHKYYPPEAAQRGEEGAATLLITVSRDGHVKRLRWINHSGSDLLDAAWYSVFADHVLPPLNDDIPGDEFTFAYQLDYHLIYQSGFH
jgi:TonB family protein